MFKRALFCHIKFLWGKWEIFKFKTWEWGINCKNSTKKEHITWTYLNTILFLLKRRFYHWNTIIDSNIYFWYLIFTSFLRNFFWQQIVQPDITCNTGCSQLLAMVLVILVWSMGIRSFIFLLKVSHNLDWCQSGAI